LVRGLMSVADAQQRAQARKGDDKESERNQRGMRAGRVDRSRASRTGCPATTLPMVAASIALASTPFSPLSAVRDLVGSHSKDVRVFKAGNGTLGAFLRAPWLSLNTLASSIGSEFNGRALSNAPRRESKGVGRGKREEPEGYEGAGSDAYRQWTSASGTNWQPRPSRAAQRPGPTRAARGPGRLSAGQRGPSRTAPHGRSRGGGRPHGGGPPGCGTASARRAPSRRRPP